MKGIIIKGIAIGLGFGIAKAILDETVLKKWREEAAEEARFEEEINKFCEDLVRDAFPAPDFLSELDIDHMVDFKDLEL